MSTATRKRLSPEERAHVTILRQEAKRERLMRAVEHRADEIAEMRELMESEGLHALAAERAVNPWDLWEARALQAINDGRVPSPRCSTLPGWAYEQKTCALYAGCQV